MKTKALPVSRQPFQSWPGLTARVPDFIALTKPRVMAPAVFTAGVGMVIFGFGGPIHGAMAVAGGTIFFALPARSSLGRRADRWVSQRLFVFSISYLILLFAAILADHHGDRWSTGYVAGIDRGPVRAECLTYAVRAARDCTWFTVVED